MLISNVHMVSKIELRFTITDGERVTSRMIFPRHDATPVEVATMIANNVNRYTRDKAAGFPIDYDAATHVAAILADAPYYGTD